MLLGDRLDTNKIWADVVIFDQFNKETFEYSIHFGLLSVPTCLACLDAHGVEAINTFNFATQASSRIRSNELRFTMLSLRTMVPIKTG